MSWTMIQAPMNLSHVVTIGTFRGGSVGGLEEGKGVQPILGRKNHSPNTKTAESCTQKMRLGFSQIYHHLLKLLTSLFDILQPFSEISSINLKFIPLKLMTIFRSEKNQKHLKKKRSLFFLSVFLSFQEKILTEMDPIIRGLAPREPAYNGIIVAGD